MIIVTILRWLLGYSEICIKGHFPERFLNLAARNGLNLWKLKSAEDQITAFVRTSEADTALSLAAGSETNVTVTRNYGLPCLCRRYRHRSGILCGALAGGLLCAWLSGFIWIIKINAPAGINEYELRQELSELGFYQGIRYDERMVSQTEDDMRLKDGRISWISINVCGVAAEVNLSTRADTDKRKPAAEKEKVGNLRSTADGTITRIIVRKGNAAVRAGEGVRKGQLLVSGVTTYTDGTSSLCESEGEVYAKTSRTVSFTLPKEYKDISFTGESVSKTKMTMFGLDIPLSIRGSSESMHISLNERYQGMILGSEIPVQFSTEAQRDSEICNIRQNKETAKKILDNRARLYEAFLCGNGKNTIMSRTQHMSENDSSYTLTLIYEVEEEISEKSEIGIKTTG